jgi:hypothetical protein
VSNVHVTNIAATTVTAALPVNRYAHCYHGASGSHASVSVHIDLNKTGTVAHCGVDDPSLAELGACLVDASKRISVPGIPDDGATADVQVDFDVP